MAVHVLCTNILNHSLSCTLAAQRCTIHRRTAAQDAAVQLVELRRRCPHHWRDTGFMPAQHTVIIAAAVHFFSPACLQVLLSGGPAGEGGMSVGQRGWRAGGGGEADCDEVRMAPFIRRSAFCQPVHITTETVMNM